MTRPELAAIRKLFSASTPGHLCRSFDSVHYDDVDRLAFRQGDKIAEFFGQRIREDADFFVAVHNTMPSLFSHIDSLEALMREYPPQHKPECGWHKQIGYLNEMGFARERHGDCDCGLAERLAELGL